MTFLVDGTNGGTFPSWTTATRPASPAVGQMGYNTTTGQFDQYTSFGWASISGATTPQVTTYTSGSGTYTTPTGAKYLYVKMIGAGGGGAGGGYGAVIATGGGTGGTTTFGTSLLTCTGGDGGSYAGAPGNGGVGGSGTINSPATGLTARGGTAQSISLINSGSPAGTPGGSSAFGGSGATIGGVPLVGYNGGGGGGGGGSNTYNGAGGGGGGYVEAYIPSPSATYSYAVGAAGTAGSAGSNGSPGSTGGAGLIIVTAFF